jgi:N-methylhydantoinase B
MNATVDSASLEIFKNALSSIADEMALVVMRTAYSPIVRDSMDFSTAVFDRSGRTIAQGLTLAIHLGAFPDAMDRLVAQIADTARPGDTYLLNDPYLAGGMHLPDWYLIRPIFFEKRLVAFSASIVHHADIGGMAPGSMALAATEIYQEGIRLPLVKLFDGGVANQALLAVLEANSRMPSQLRGDLRAQVAACLAGEKGVVELMRKHGLERFDAFVEALHDYAERLTRSAIEAMPDGEYVNVDYIDGLGVAPQEITFRVKVTVQGSDITVDWSGTSGQVQGAINCPIATTNSVAFAAVRCAIGVEVPNCAGFSRPLRILAEPGSIVHASAPAACAARGVLAYRMFDVLHGAFASIVPERMPALGEGGPSVVSLSGQVQGKTWLITDGVLGSWGGKHSGDGVDGISSPLGNLSNQPVELIEARLPLKIVRYGLAQDSGGAGRHRGGMAMLREYELLADNAQLGLRSDRRRHLPIGVEQGLPGSPSFNVLVRQGAQTLLPVMPTGLCTIHRGDRLLHLAASGAGHGDPLLREPAAVLEDVIDERISVDYAREVYAVVLDGSPLAVDDEATRRLRELASKRPVHEREAAQLRCLATAHGLPQAWVEER